MPRTKADEPEVDDDAPPDHATPHWNPPVSAIPNADPERAAPTPPVHYNGPPAVIQVHKNETPAED